MGMGRRGGPDHGGGMGGVAVACVGGGGAATAADVLPYAGPAAWPV